MPRNTGGTYEVPNAFTTGTTIRSNDVNENFADAGAEITTSLSRYGYGGMLAQLKTISGSAAAPSYSFTEDPGVGMWLPAANQLAVSAQAANLQTWTLTAITLTRPTTVTTSVSNTAGVTTTGNGTGAGVVATGGATGNGVTATGGATSGAGGAFTGTGGGNGVTATGQGAGAGVNATGGATGNGITASGGVTSGVGVSATGTGSSTGVSGTGGSGTTSTDNTTLGVGVLGTGGGSGPGVRAIGGTGGTGGDGLVAIGGGSAGRGINVLGGTGQAGAIITAGTAASATTPRTAVRVSAGYIAFENTTSPNSNVAVTNTLTPINIVKAWGDIGTPLTTPTVAAGFNITAAYSGGNLRITFAQAMASINYAVVATVRQGQRAAYVSTKATTHFDLTLYATNGADASTLSFNGAGFDVHFMVLGAQ